MILILSGPFPVSAGSIFLALLGQHELGRLQLGQLGRIQGRIEGQERGGQQEGIALQQIQRGAAGRHSRAGLRLGE
jgi:hypothetical protein